MEWSDDDMQWIATVDQKFDEMLGSDFLNYGQTETKNCIVDESSISDKYKHLFCEETPTVKQNHVTPGLPSETTEHAREAKVIKVNRELNFATPKRTVVRIPRVCPWGGWIIQIRLWSHSHQLNKDLPYR